MAKERDRYAAGRRDKHRRLRNQARDREAMEELKGLKFMQEKHATPQQWQAQLVKADAIKAIKAEYQAIIDDHAERIAELETAMAMRKSGPDWPCRTVAVFSALLSAVCAAVVLLAIRQ